MSFRGYIQKRVIDMLGRSLTKTEYEVHEATLQALRDDAIHRVTKALLAAVGPAARHDYQLDVGFHTAVDLVVRVTVGAVFDGLTGDTPDSLPATVIDALFGDIDIKFKVPHSSGSSAYAGILKSGSSGLPAAQPLPGITVKMLEQAMEAMKAKSIHFVDTPAMHPLQTGQIGQLGAVGVVAKPTKKPKSKSRKMALAELAALAEERAKKLRAAKAPAKYQEMTGKTLTPEEAEQMINKALEGS